MEKGGSVEISGMPVFNLESSTSNPSVRGVHVNIDLERRETLMRILHKTINVAGSLLDRCKLKEFVANICEVLVWKCVPPLVSYCCDIADDKDMQAVKPDDVVKRPYV